MHAFNPLSKDELGKPVDQTINGYMIDSLLYLTTSRPNIMHIVCLCVRIQFNHRESHLKAIKRILHYLVGTTNQSLFYKKNQDFRLVGYYDTYYGGDRVEQKSISDGYHYIGPYMISWASKK